VSFCAALAALAKAHSALRLVAPVLRDHDALSALGVMLGVDARLQDKRWCDVVLDVEAQAKSDCWERSEPRWGDGRCVRWARVQ
jgi:hypothetical protein